jgi:hypothetical protein
MWPTMGLCELIFILVLPVLGGESAECVVARAVISLDVLHEARARPPDCVLLARGRRRIPTIMSAGVSVVLCRYAYGTRQFIIVLPFQFPIHNTLYRVVEFTTGFS